MITFKRFYIFLLLLGCYCRENIAISKIDSELYKLIVKERLQNIGSKCLSVSGITVDVNKMLFKPLSQTTKYKYIDELKKDLGDNADLLEKFLEEVTKNLKLYKIDFDTLSNKVNFVGHRIKKRDFKDNEISKCYNLRFSPVTLSNDKKRALLYAEHTEPNKRHGIGLLIVFYKRDKWEVTKEIVLFQT